MSRLGRKPLILPDGIKITTEGRKVTVTGPKGTAERTLPANITLKIDEPQKKVLVECVYHEAQDKAIHGLTRSLINNMIIGITKGYEKRLEIIGVGYNAKIQGTELIIRVGYSHPVKTLIPEGITITVPNPNLVVVQGIDKQLVTHFADILKHIKPCNPYTLKGLKYTEISMKKKPGKTFVSGS